MPALVRRLLLVCMLLGVKAADSLSADKMDTTLPQAYGDYGADAARATRENMGTTGDASVADKASSADTSNAGRTSGLAKGTFRLAKKTSKLIKRKMVPLKRAVTAVRPWSFSATLSPVFLGTALAFQMEGKFDVKMLVLSLITSLGVHAAGNLMNTYFDYKNGVDKLGVTSDTTLVDGKMQPRQVALLVSNSYAIAAAAAFPLCSITNAPLEVMLSHLAAGATAAFVYTGGPGLKYKALGDVLISSTFGPLLVSFAFLVQAGWTGWVPILASLPLTAHIEAILHANNARDVDEDKANGVITLAAVVSKKASFSLYTALILAPFAASFTESWRHSLLAGLPLFAAPMGWRLVQDFRQNRMVGLPKRTAKFQFIYSGFLVMSVLMPPVPMLRLSRMFFSP